MQIGIIETGKVNESLRARHGDYPEMFETLLGRVDPSLGFLTWSAVDGHVPEDPDACDAWLITGSRHGVYDELPWIEPLKEFLRGARKAGRPIIGVCFGHQILAEALGGTAVKSDKGWGVGVLEYEVIRRPSWMADAPDHVAVHALHQDQIIELPEDAVILGKSAFCPYAMVAYGNPEQPDAISVQPHPEFDVAFMRDLIELRTGDLIPRDRGEAALRSLGRPVAADAFARWFVDYLRVAKEQRSAA